jgi:hypothetical protein
VDSEGEGGGLLGDGHPLVAVPQTIRSTQDNLIINVYFEQETTWKDLEPSSALDA